MPTYVIMSLKKGGEWLRRGSWSFRSIQRRMGTS